MPKATSFPDRISFRIFTCPWKCGAAAALAVMALSVFGTLIIWGLGLVVALILLTTAMCTEGIKEYDPLSETYHYRFLETETRLLKFSGSYILVFFSMSILLYLSRR